MNEQLNETWTRFIKKKRLKWLLDSGEMPEVLHFCCECRLALLGNALSFETKSDRISLIGFGKTYTMDAYPSKIIDVICEYLMSLPKAYIEELFEVWGLSPLSKTENLRQYTIGVLSYPELTDPQIRELIDRQRTDFTARRILNQSGLQLVLLEVVKYKREGMEMLDLINEGNVVMNRAIDTYDTNKSYRYEHHVRALIHTCFEIAKYEYRKTK
jgi:hypothetical protein